MAEALKKFPRYEIEAKAGTRNARSVEDDWTLYGTKHMTPSKQANQKSGRGQELRAARFASFDSNAVSDAAHGLIDRLTQDVAEWEIRWGHRKRNRRETNDRLRNAVSSFIGDLLLTHHDRDTTHGWVHRALHAKRFTGGRVSYRTFLALVEALKDLKLLEHKEGVAVWGEDFDPGMQRVRFRQASRFRGTPKLLTLCRKFGIIDTNIAEHFTAGLPETPLVKKSASRRVGRDKERGKRMKFEQTPTTKRLEDQVRRLNEFLDAHVIRGGTHRGFERQFNNGDQPLFDWNKGGRLYSVGAKSYQQIPSPDRLRMTIDGAPVCEIDVRASHLTILHAQHQKPFKVSESHHPYDIPGLGTSGTWAVKSWVSISLGSKSLPKRWPPNARTDYGKETGGRNLSKDFPITVVGKIMTETFPLMARWTDLPETWADLQWLESNAIVATMLELADNDVPSLPVHDSLIIPVSAEALAREVLCRHYSVACGTKPTIISHYPPQPTSSTTAVL